MRCGLRLVACLLLFYAPAARAQESGKLPRIGVLSWYASGPASDRFMRPFREGLAQLGHGEGRTLVIEYRSAAGNADVAASLAAQLVAMKVDVLIGWSTPAAHALKKASNTIPIVIAVADPQATGLVDNLAQPGGNITGFSTMSAELASKRLELLREVLPGTRQIAFLGNSLDPNATTFLRETQAAGRSFGLEVTPFLIRGPAGLDDAIETMAKQGIAAAIVQPIFADHYPQIASSAIRHRIVAIGDYPDFAQAGALFTFSASLDEIFRRSASYVDRILKGAAIRTLPIQQPTKFQLIVNLRTAHALGIQVPDPVLARADEVIE
jgi:putative ABC transport system substrate-binding protein